MALGSHSLVVTATDIDGKSTSVRSDFLKVTDLGFVAPLPDESFYMPFDGDNANRFAYRADKATVVGIPGFEANGWQKEAYKGAENSYLELPTAGLLGDEFSAAFWYKVNPTPDRAGMLVIGATPDNRNQGIRLFREGNATEQRIKLNVGTGGGETWNDGDVLDATSAEWVHIAFTISASKTTIYFNGVEKRAADLPAKIDWTGCDVATIASGGETFSYWNHKSDLSLMDELRFFNKALTQAEIASIMADVPDELDSETLYMSFNGNYMPQMVATTVGVPSYAEDSKYREAYKGAENAYLEVPTAGLLSDEFSAAFWYKVNPTPDRAGMLVIGATPDNRNQGIRLFREGNATEQRIKLNVGTGSSDAWNDGDVLDATSAEWVHIAVTISASKSTIYFNGVEKRTADLPAKIDWTGCDVATIASGGETFSYWGHESDLSLMDEMRFFNKALSQAEIKAIYDSEL
ncbi:MAG: LamG domain-containing protein [Cyclobacteriaceae bacterium]|nr:LamG domain-containing protein [Cyclobacteriaceae bacterium]